MQLRQFRFHLLVTQTQWGTSAPIDSVKFVFLRAVDDGEQIAANAVGDWLHQTERRVRRDRRIHGAAASFQNVEAYLRSCRHARANHSMSRQHFRPRGEILSRDSINLGVQGKNEDSAQEDHRDLSPHQPNLD